jgi:hypothetical protein
MKCFLYGAINFKERAEKVRDNNHIKVIWCFNFGLFENFTFWGMHLFLFIQYTMHEMIKKARLTVTWVKGVQRYTSVNHLYLQANRKPSGHKLWSFF